MSIETQPRSVSQTEQYEKCAWRYYLQRVERVTPRPAAWSHHGTAFHAAAEAVERSGRTMTAEEAVALFSELYSAAVNTSLEEEPNTDRWLAAGVTPGEDIERRYRMGQEQTARYVAWTQEQQPEIWTTPSGQPALELEFLVELGGVRVRGFIDQVTVEPDHTLRIRDLKTGTTKSHFQLETYKVAVEQAYDVPVARGDWYLAKNGNLSRPVQLNQVTAEEVGERFAAMDAGVRRGDFPAKPGFQCRFCDVSHACAYT
ncbi:PD-(D/E)XK nuclease family protein [Streptomyces sp. UNOB3_S3]|uniref:RecB family exonuclease n=1 Tax=Streptomyces sp. UNOB3_S3 TaxID=2871682 RepID=UPI001E64C9CF|nr:PD-(D/E)XK nuclease family protein [Streptomyces sp. UNOB3_S3]MCC3775178.1 PD-(D/E)XK nuclease family protein [Streptomyces sp. UNOB3_S3]